MGFMDGFTSDGTVEMKHREFYDLMREAARAELMENALEAGVPGKYVKAMATGKIEETEVTEIEKLDCDMWGRLAAAMKDIFNDYQEDVEIQEIKEAIQEMAEDLAGTRRRELWIHSKRMELAEAVIKKAIIPPLADRLAEGTTAESEGTNNGNVSVD